MLFLFFRFLGYVNIQLPLPTFTCHLQKQRSWFVEPASTRARYLLFLSKRGPEMFMKMKCVVQSTVFAPSEHGCRRTMIKTLFMLTLEKAIKSFIGVLTVLRTRKLEFGLEDTQLCRYNENSA
jgi:hypothetical protein